MFTITERLYKKGRKERQTERKEKVNYPTTKRN